MDREIEYGKILAFIATYDPMLTENKIKSCTYFMRGISEFNVDKAKIVTAFHNEISEMEQRRTIKFVGVKEFSKRIFILE